MTVAEKIEALVSEGLAYSEEEALAQLQNMGEDYDEDDSYTDRVFGYAGDGVIAAND
jgi:hypothetical protein